MAKNKKKRIKDKIGCDKCGSDYHNSHNCTLDEPITDEMLGIEIKEMVNHPAHYGGENNPYEAIKVIEAWDLDFHIGNCIKYLSRAGKKGDELEDLRKSRWYLDRKIKLLEEEKK
jgi:hypothetical protein